jgi:8-oxo-dGTP pyrophosphatase MutT (NUDIX family)
MAISPYVAALRERIGNALLLLPAAAVIPKDDDGRILLVRQSQHDKWETIGGTVEPDESPFEAAVREAKEEAGIDVEISLLTVLGGPDYVTTYPNGDRCQYVSSVFDARIVGGVPTPDGDETSDVVWFAPDELADADLGPFCRATLRELGFPV